MPYKSIGINLKVTPQVNARGFIKLTVVPEVSLQERFRQLRRRRQRLWPRSRSSRPARPRRRCRSRTAYDDGHRRPDHQNQLDGTSDTKIPGLGRHPGAGLPLQVEKAENALTTTNLLIFITAKSIAADGAPVEQIF